MYKVRLLIELKQNIGSDPFNAPTMYRTKLCYNAVD